MVDNFQQNKKVVVFSEQVLCWSFGVGVEVVLGLGLAVRFGAVFDISFS